jgi:Plavaka transposase
MIAQDPTTHGATFVPIILGSDKTTVSVATGHTEAYPLYLSIGNLQNNLRRSHRGGVVLIAFLAIAKSKRVLLCFHVH